ncbi:MAG: SusC/RagA family TonB-linked outer membrane protein, partial [Muribaculaceae bacterium]|nr:SusC/RagA family TonB-linked outer membrane protein [Muribaculaceae bacterium]
IESVSVLKDASAAAIYGAKASSGVILITTKKGADTGGKANVTYNGRFGWRQNTTTTDFITDSYDHVTIVNRFYSAYNNKPMYKLSDEEMQMLYEHRGETAPTAEHPWVVTDRDGKYMYYGNFDWYNYLYRKTRPETEHNVSISGGNKSVNYFVSGRSLQQDGMHNIYHDRYKNYSFRAKLNVRLSDRIRYQANMNFNSNEYKYAGYFDESNTLGYMMYNLSPLVSPRNPDGTVVQYINQLDANSPIGGGHAGMLTADKNRNSRLNNYMVITNQFDVDIYKDLTFTGSYSYRSRNRINRYRNNDFDYSRTEGEITNFKSGSIFDYYQEYHGNINHHAVNAFLTYGHTWNKK